MALLSSFKVKASQKHRMLVIFPEGNTVALWFAPRSEVQGLNHTPVPSVWTHVPPVVFKVSSVFPDMKVM